LIQEVTELKAKADAAGRDYSDCRGLDGYEGETPGDGIIGYYFDNEAF